MITQQSLKEAQREFDERRLEHMASRALFEDFEKDPRMSAALKEEARALFGELEASWKAYEENYTRMMEAAGVIWDSIT